MKVGTYGILSTSQMKLQSLCHEQTKTCDTQFELLSTPSVLGIHEHGKCISAA